MIVDSRVERKFTSGLFRSDFFKKILFLNSFMPLYENRLVNSIYLDNEEYIFFKKNIDGISERKKIRFRWYNHDKKKIFLEEKNKKGFLVTKKITPVNLDLSNNFKSSINLFMKNNNYNCLRDSNYKCILKTSYVRSYFISHDKKIRATIDTNLNTSSYEYLYNTIFIPETVLEFKYSPIDEIYFRNFFKYVASSLRAVKYSKYVRSFIELNNTCLLN